MTLQVFAILRRFHVRILAMLVLGTCACVGLHAHVSVVSAMTLALVAELRFTLPIFGMHIAEFYAFEELFDIVHLEHDVITGAQGSCRPVRFSLLVEVGLVSVGRGAERDPHYFLRAADGAWCAFPARHATATLVWHLEGLDGFSASAGESEHEEPRTLWRSA